MISRLIFPVLLFLPGCLYAQNCSGPIFAGTKEATLFDYTDLTFLIRQPNASFDGVVADVSSLQIETLYPNYQNVVISGCAANATPTKTPPNLPDIPPTTGTGSQTIAIADFMNSGIPSG